MAIDAHGRHAAGPPARPSARRATRERPPGRRRRVRRGSAVTGAALAVVSILSVGGVAWAWFDTGTGTGTFSTSADASGVTAEVAPIQGLAPGVDQPVTVTIDNATDAPVTITALDIGHAALADASAGACDPAVVSIRPAETSSVTAPPGRSSLAAVATMSADAPDGCQGAAFTLSLVVTGTI